MPAALHPRPQRPASAPSAFPAASRGKRAQACDGVDAARGDEHQGPAMAAQMLQAIDRADEVCARRHSRGCCHSPHGRWARPSIRSASRRDPSRPDPRANGRRHGQSARRRRPACRAEFAAAATQIVEGGDLPVRMDALSQSAAEAPTNPAPPVTRTRVATISPRVTSARRAGAIAPKKRHSAARRYYNGHIEL